MKTGNIQKADQGNRNSRKSFGFSGAHIDTVGYDAQREELEVRMAETGRSRRYQGVPEEVWYRFRESADPELFYRRGICGHFPELPSENRTHGAHGTYGAHGTHGTHGPRCEKT